MNSGANQIVLNRMQQASKNMRRSIVHLPLESVTKSLLTPYGVLVLVLALLHFSGTKRYVSMRFCLILLTQVEADKAE